MDQQTADLIRTGICYISWAGGIVGCVYSICKYVASPFLESIIAEERLGVERYKANLEARTQMTSKILEGEKGIKPGELAEILNATFPHE